ncbi:MAG: glycosyltransferase family 2 protein [Gammaproteobacteria bacterium]|nr:glycosyltransferase family 2 protein [Gammaproteobacteria bacterium]
MVEARVSVIMPCFNGLPYLRESMASVLEQAHGDIELLVIDDGSVDGSREYIAEQALVDPRIRPLATRGREGPATARNLGIGAASGRYLAFLDADDIWLPTKLAVQLELMQQADVVFSWCPFIEITADGVRGRTVESWQHCSAEDLLDKRTVIGCSTVIYDRERLGTEFMPDIRMRQDLGLWLRLLRMCEDRGLKAQGLEHALVLYRVHPGSLSSGKLRAAFYQWRLLRDVERLSLGRAGVRFAAYAWRSVAARL